MANESTQLARCDYQLLMRAALEISREDLKKLVNDSIQHGPAPSLRGPLHKIEQKIIPPLCWESLLELVSWDAGIVVCDSQYDYLLADSAHFERVLHSIKNQLDHLDEQGSKQATMRYLQRLVIQAQTPKKHNKPYEPR